MSGDLAPYDTSRPCRISSAGDFRMLVVMSRGRMWPRAALHMPNRALSRVAAARVDGRDGAGVLATFISGLGRRRNGRWALATSARSCSRCWRTSSTPARTQPVRRSSETLLLHARHCIENRTADPDRRLDVVAEAHPLSTLCLLKLLAAKGDRPAAYAHVPTERPSTHARHARQGSSEMLAAWHYQA